MRSCASSVAHRVGYGGTPQPSRPPVRMMPPSRRVTMKPDRNIGGQSRGDPPRTDRSTSYGVVCDSVVLISPMEPRVPASEKFHVSLQWSSSARKPWMYRFSALSGTIRGVNAAVALQAKKQPGLRLSLAEPTMEMRDPLANGLVHSNTGPSTPLEGCRRTLPRHRGVGVPDMTWLIPRRAGAALLGCLIGGLSLVVQDADAGRAPSCPTTGTNDRRERAREGVPGAAALGRSLRMRVSTAQVSCGSSGRTTGMKGRAFG